MKVIKSEKCVKYTTNSNDKGKNSDMVNNMLQNIVGKV